MPYVRPDVQSLLSMLAATPGPKMEEGDAPSARAMMTMMGQMVEAPRPDIAEIKNLAIPGPAGIIPARLYRSTLATDPAPVLVFCSSVSEPSTLARHSGFSGANSRTPA